MKRHIIGLITIAAAVIVRPHDIYYYPVPCDTPGVLDYIKNCPEHWFAGCHVCVLKCPEESVQCYFEPEDQK